MNEKVYKIGDTIPEGVTVSTPLSHVDDTYTSVCITRNKKGAPRILCEVTVDFSKLSDEFIKTKAMESLVIDWQRGRRAGKFEPKSTYDPTVKVAAKKITTFEDVDSFMESATDEQRKAILAKLKGK